MNELTERLISGPVAAQREYYRRTADLYDFGHVRDGDEHERALHFIAGYLVGLCCRTVLDVGAGTGRASGALAHMAPSLKVVSAEPVRALIAAGVRRRQFAPNQAVMADGTSLPFAGQTFDAVIETGMLHHVEQPNAVVAEMLRVSRRAVCFSDSNRFGQGSLVLRLVKLALARPGLRKVVRRIQQRGRPYYMSAGDGLAYSYSVFDSLPELVGRAVQVSRFQPPAPHLPAPALFSSRVAYAFVHNSDLEPWLLSMAHRAADTAERTSGDRFVSLLRRRAARFLGNSVANRVVMQARVAQHKSRILLFTCLLGIIPTVAAVFLDVSKLALPSLLIYIALTLALAATSVITFLCLLKQYPHSTAFLHPVFLLILLILLFVTIPGLYAFFDPSLLSELSDSIGNDPQLPVLGMLVIVVGCASLSYGYFVFLRHIRPFGLMVNLAGVEINLRVILVFYALSLLVQILRIRVAGIAYGADSSYLGKLSGFSSWIDCLAELNLVILAYLSATTQRGSSYRLALYMIASTQIVIAFTSGFMKPMLWLLLAAILPKVKSNMRWHTLIPMAAILLALSIGVVPIAQNIRKISLDYSITDPASIVTVTASAFSTSWGEGFDTGWTEFVDKVLGRQAGEVQMPGLVVRDTPSEVPYEGATGFLSIASDLIPRAIWPGKPVLSRGIWFSIMYVHLPNDTRTSSTMTIFGELYIFMGWFGIVIGCLLLGALFAVLYVNTANIGLIAIFAGLAPVFLDVDNQFTTVVIGLIQQGMAFVALWWLMSRLTSKPGR